MNATEYHFPALHFSNLCQAVWDEQPIRKKVFPALLARMAFLIMLRMRCRVLPMRSSERIERDNWACVLLSAAAFRRKFLDWLFNHVSKNIFL